MHTHIRKASSVQNGKKTNGEKIVKPLQRPPPTHPHFAPLRLPIGIIEAVQTNNRPTSTDIGCAMVSQCPDFLFGVFLLSMCYSLVMAGTCSICVADIVHYHIPCSYFAEVSVLTVDSPDNGQFR
jgi:hypothetical protein